jgi:hypothetical protein
VAWGRGHCNKLRVQGVRLWGLLWERHGCKRWVVWRRGYCHNLLRESGNKGCCCGRGRAAGFLNWRHGAGRGGMYGCNMQHGVWQGVLLWETRGQVAGGMGQGALQQATGSQAVGAAVGEAMGASGGWCGAGATATRCRKLGKGG